MNLIDELVELGVNKEDAMQRFMNNSALYERMLKKLPKSVREFEVLPYLESGDYAQALSNAHTLKGVMGNLSVIPLYDAYTEIVALLRLNNNQRAVDVMKSIIEIQDKIISCIENN